MFPEQRSAKKCQFYFTIVRIFGIEWRQRIEGKILISLSMKVSSAALVAVLVAGCTEGQFETRTLNTSDLTRIENPDARIGMLKSTLAADPQNIAALKSLGQEYSGQARWPESAAAYREALILKGNDRDALIGHSKALSAQGSYAPALVEAKKAISAKADVDAYIAAGVAQDGLGQQVAAQEYYDKALAKNRRDLDVRSNIALSKAMQGDASAYSLMSGVALAPDADDRHRANMVLVSALLGRMNDAKAYGAKFGMSRKDVNEVLRIAAKARTQGAAAFGIARRN